MAVDEGSAELESSSLGDELDESARDLAPAKSSSDECSSRELIRLSNTFDKNFVIITSTISEDLP